MFTGRPGLGKSRRCVSSPVVGRARVLETEVSVRSGRFLESERLSEDDGGSEAV